MEDAPKTVCVTGASGYIASVLVQQLKAEGYRVRGTVRSVDRYRDDPLFESVELFEADLLNKQSFAMPFSGCDVVMHTASPFWFPNASHDPYDDFVKPALLGTQNVLQMAYAAGVRTIVITGSTGAVTPQVPSNFPSETKPGHTRPFDETDWSTDSTLELQPYRYSKRVAEKAAWEFAAEHPDLHLTVLNPSGTLGPLALSRADGECVKLMKRILEGGDDGAVSNQFIGWVDVRDVAQAHIRAMRPEARGLRIIVSLPLAATYLDLAQYLAQQGSEFERYKLPNRLDGPSGMRVQYSNERARRVLGMEFRPLRDTVVDMARDMVRRGIVKPIKPDRLVMLCASIVATCGVLLLRSKALKTI